MDISIIGKNTLKLKGRRVTFVVDPGKETPKTVSDAVILLNGSRDVDVSKVAGSPIIIDGPGGYEIGGAKISGTKTPSGTLYRLSIDDINLVLGSGADAKIDGFNVCQVAVINTANDFNESFVTALEPKIIFLYGDKKKDAAKTLGAENAALVSKITITKDKLPEKMEVVVLG